MRVLSTKKLNLSQKELLLNSNISLVEYNAIKVELVPISIPEVIPNAIFTSQNAVHSFTQFAPKKTEINRIFCVGKETRALLENFGQKVTYFARNAAELGDYLVKNNKNQVFYYFEGNRSLEVIPSIVKNSKNELFRIKTYKTELNPKYFDQNFDGILFFSPSGVQSFTIENEIGATSCFCIGNTTASEVKKHTNNYIISNESTVASVIAKMVKTLIKND